MIQFSSAGSYLIYDKEESTAVQRAARYANIRMNFSAERLPSDCGRRIQIKEHKLMNSVLVELVVIERKSLRLRSELVGVVGVRLTGRKEELVWIDYSDCHYRTVTLNPLWKMEKCIDLSMILSRAPHERYSFTNVNPSSFKERLSI